MNYLIEVQRGIDYIESNLDFDISLSQVSKSANLSQWHFQRIFKALTNETLKTYIRSRRLANALDKLLDKNQKIIDIAFSAGYESQESFTRAFKNTYALTPNQYRSLGNRNLFLKKLEFDQNYLEHIHNNITLEPIIYQQAAMTMVGLKTCFYSVDSEKNNIAEKLPPLWESFSNTESDIRHTIAGNAYGVIHQIQSDSALLDYYAAYEVKHAEKLAKGMALIEIPSSMYARFSHRGLATELDNTVNYIYASWLLSSGKKHTGGPDLEIYGPEYNPDSEESVIGYAIPIQ